MAKGDVTLQLDADSAKMVASILKATDAMKAAGSHARDMGEAFKRGGDMGAKAWEGLGGALGLATSYAGAAAAAAAVTLTMKTVEDYIDRIERRAAIVRQEVATLSGAMASSGEIAQYPGMQNKIDELANAPVHGMKFAAGELGRVYNTVSRQSGIRATADQKFDSLESYEQARAGGLSEGDATDVALQHVRLAPMGLADQSLAAHAAGMTEDDMRILYRAKDKPGALNLIFAAHRVDEGSRILMQMEAEAAKHKIPLTEFIGQPHHFQDPKEQLAFDSLASGAADLAQHPMATLAQQMASVDANKALRQQKEEKNTQTIRERTAEDPAALMESALHARIAALKEKAYPNVPTDFLRRFLPETDEIRKDPEVWRLSNELYWHHSPEEDARLRKQSGVAPYTAPQSNAEQTQILRMIHEAILTTPARNNDRYLRSNNAGQA